MGTWASRLGHGMDGKLGLYGRPMTAGARDRREIGSARRRPAGAWASWLLAIALFTSSSVWALDPDRRISQYGHTAWRISDGDFPVEPYGITQTRDGFLWIGNADGLLRFDGARFVPWSPPDGQNLPVRGVNALLGARDGSLWIGGLGHLSQWANGHLTDHPITGQVTSVIQRRNGEIWFGCVQCTGGMRALCRVDPAGVQCPEGLDDVGFVYALAEDSQDNLWVGGNAGLARWAGGNSRQFKVPGIDNAMLGVTGVAPTADGSVWMGIAVPGDGRGLQRLVEGAWKPFDTPELKGSTLTVTALLADRNGDLWVGTFAQGIYRIHGAKVDHFQRKDGLSGDFVHRFYEDREGNLWVDTTKGLDRFRDLAVATFSTPEGLTTEEVDSVLASRDGTVWIGGGESLDALRDGAISSFRTGSGLPGTQVTSLLEDHAGRLWVGIDNTLTLLHDGSFERIDMPDGSPIGFVVGLAEDVDNSVWAEAYGAPRKLVHLEGRRVVGVYPDPEVPASRVIAPDSDGGIWLGLGNGRLARLRDGKLESFSFSAAAIPPGEHYPIKQLVTSKGTLLGATVFGLIGWNKGTKRILTTRNGLPCDSVRALVTDRGGNLWLDTQCGLVRIALTDLQTWWRDENVRLQPTVFDALDGWLPGPAPFQNSAARSPDGRLWFAKGSVLQMIDPDHLPRSPRPPPVLIEEVVADRRSYPPSAPFKLPSLTRDLEIRYTAPSLAVPQKVRFRYRLEGRDGDWVDAATRRQAFYNDLSPGDYRFRVIACNNDGVCNETGATLGFEVLPTFYQTRRFLALCLGATACFAWAGYRWRLHRVTARLERRHRDRLAERTRIARDLHDTLLGDMAGVAMQLSAASRRAETAGATDAPLVGLLAGLGAQVQQALTEARRAVTAMRNPPDEAPSLVDRLSESADRTFAGSGIAVEVERVGTPRRYPESVEAEVVRIATEAMTNARQHAGCRRVEISCTHGRRHLQVRVRDDGRGFDPHEQAPTGHWGLVGMRERSAAIGARLAITSAPGAGTEVLLVVPASAWRRR
jgi:signal transduction histidine kinase/ligand-binding sensor domain-containing protein